MFGIDDAIGAVGGLFKTVLDKWVPDANAKVELQQAHDAETAAAAQLAVQVEGQKYAADVDLLKKQLDVNIAYSSSPNKWLAGARPYAMYLFPTTVVLCSILLLWLLHEGKSIGEYFEVYFALISLTAGLFGLHSYERHKGVSPEQPDGPNVPAPYSVAATLATKAISTVVGKLPRA